MTLLVLHHSHLELLQCVRHLAPLLGPAPAQHPDIGAGVVSVRGGETAGDIDTGVHWSGQPQQRQVIVKRAGEKSLVEENVTENN